LPRGEKKRKTGEGKGSEDSSTAEGGKEKQSCGWENMEKGGAGIKKLKIQRDFLETGKTEELVAGEEKGERRPRSSEEKLREGLENLGRSRLRGDEKHSGRRGRNGWWRNSRIRGTP